MDRGLSAEEDLMARMKGMLSNSFSEAGSGRGISDDRLEQRSIDGASSSFSIDGCSEALGDGDMSYTTGDTLNGHAHGEDGTSSSDGSSPLGWPLGRRERSGSEASPGGPKLHGNSSFMWEEKREKRETELSEVEMMKERFAKLLLGEDMSGGGKGVCTALAISNAITNLSASVFGELWRLEPLAPERRTMWRREMEWLLSVSDHVVELVPSWQTFPDGSSLEVMVSRPRSDLHVNLPALRKLDTMLLDSLENFHDTDFWYVDRGIAVADKDPRNVNRHPVQRQEEKWWLPTPKVPNTGLSEDTRKKLQYQRECTSQILKAAMAINGSVLSEMEAPEVYLESLPKNGKTSLGNTIYASLVSDNFNPEAVLSTVDLSTEHSTLEIANRLETAILVWRRKIHNKSNPNLANAKDHRFAKSSWGMMKDLVGDVDKRELIADRAETILLMLKQKFPGLPQTALDMNKIQFNKDVGQSILESYSRVLESLAFNILARVDDVLYADDLARRSLAPPASSGSGRSFSSTQRRSLNAPGLRSSNTPYETPYSSPSRSPTPTLAVTPNSPRSTHGDRLTLVPSLGKALTDYIGMDNEKIGRDGPMGKSPLRDSNKLWSYANNLTDSNALHSPPSRD
ncbi:protein MpKAR [Marchantia polymorpha subsp. ruderalis]|uniref:PRONE domain-containing protein n=2 Tax=Marchantia polymorpha TaxID=3197 RepID=A0A176WSJ4_MARPO|nr:hypothetical protein AXG93_2841s1150 [Marchantia polymorpha subsp. ruderalis]PTQ28190.1 hypothetical protein MARPO_0171s0028 [Marchantia polymorpha]BBN10803.1 hypothetical protein Mp_5g06550 [Marchantia polymorpha subsp. ruderalis]|eukprot:PTQ28190.1 hypothetical protein MARPO_0171s0028 [Marchantia polymorpha]